MSDEELVALFQAGNTAAFDELFQRYEPPLHRYLVGLTGGDGRACDFTQETFIKAYHKLPPIQELVCSIAEKPFKAWLYRVAINLVKNDRRRRQLIDWLPWAEHEEHDADSATEGLYVAGPEQQVEGADFIRRLLAEVSLKYRPCLYLDIFEDMKQHEIADLLNISERSVRRYIKLGKDELCRAYDRLAEQDLSMRRRDTR